jgi:transcriptional regulator with XRE-family HTH domain
VTSQTPRARYLGAELRDARSNAGLGVRQLARQLGIGHGKISLWENGKKIPSTEDVASYLAAVGVTGDERERLLELARLAEQPNWLAIGIPGIAEELAALMEFERTAEAIIDWSLVLIPGVMQTGDYARAIMDVQPMADTRVAMRLGRRDILVRRNPVQFTALIGEYALRQPIAEPDVMADQLRHLRQTAELPNVTIQVIPSSTGFHPGLMGPFVVLKFPKAKPIVHLEHHRGSAFIFEDDDVAAYLDAAEIIRREVAMSPEESAGLIAEVIRRETT